MSKCRRCRGFHGFEVIKNWFGHGCKTISFQVHILRARSVAGYMGRALSSSKWLNGLGACSILRYFSSSVDQSPRTCSRFSEKHLRILKFIMVSGMIIQYRNVKFLGLASQGKLAVVKLRLPNTTLSMDYFSHWDWQQKSNGIVWRTLSTLILRQVRC